MQHKPAKALGVLNLEHAPRFHAAEFTNIRDLPAHLRVKIGLVKHDPDTVQPSDRRVRVLIKVLGVPDRLDRRARFASIKLVRVVRRFDVHHAKLGDLFRAEFNHPLPIILLPTLPRAFLRFFHRLLEPSKINLKPPLLRHDLRQVDREAVGVVELEGVLARNSSACGIKVIKHLDPPIKCPPKALLFIRNNLIHPLRIVPQLRERITQQLHNSGGQVRHEPLRRIELLTTIPNRTPQDTTQHIPAALITRSRPIGDRHHKRTNMIRDHAVRFIHTALIFRAELPAVRASPRQLLNLRKDRHEQIRVVVAPHILQHRHNPLQPHPRIHMLRRKHTQLAALKTIELDKHIVPDLKHIRIIHIHQVRRVATTDAVVMQLRARPARPRVPHLPKVVLHIPGKDVILRKVFHPDRFSLQIRRQILIRIPFKVGRVQPIRINPPNLGQQLKRPPDRFLLEVVPERPVPQHLKESMVVSVLAHIIKIVVLAPSADALLRVDRTLHPMQRRGRIERPLKDRLELIHPGIGKGIPKRRIVRRTSRRRWNKGVPALLEELNELSPDLSSGGRRLGGRHTTVPI